MRGISSGNHRPPVCSHHEWTWFLGLVLLVALSGCGVRQLARGDIQPPKVTLQAITLGLPGPEWPMGFTLLLDNPNPEELRLQGYDLELGLEGKSVARGAGDEAVTLPPHGQAVVQVPILVKTRAVLGLLPSLLQPRQKIRYQLTGGVRLASLLGGMRVPFQFQGEITPKEGLEYLRPFLPEPTGKY